MPTKDAPRGKEIVRDTPSSGERKGKSPNLSRAKPASVAAQGLWELPVRDAALTQSYKVFH